jgi:hypothetical protein
MALKIILRQQAEYDTCSRRREDNAKGIFVNSGNTLVACQRIGWNGNNPSGRIAISAGRRL